MARRCILLVPIALTLSSCDPPPLAQDTIKCVVALSMGEPGAGGPVQYSIPNREAALGHFKWKAAAQLKAEQRSAAVIERARQQFNNDPTLHRRTAKACADWAHLVLSEAHRPVTEGAAAAVPA